MTKTICNHIGCKKKLKSVELLFAKCKCEKYFCSKHRLPELHDCRYDHKNVDKDSVIKELRCVADKIERIN